MEKIRGKARKISQNFNFIIEVSSKLPNIFSKIATVYLLYTQNCKVL